MALYTSVGLCTLEVSFHLSWFVNIPRFRVCWLIRLPVEAGTLGSPGIEKNEIGAKSCTSSVKHWTGTAKSCFGRCQKRHSKSWKLPYSLIIRLRLSLPGYQALWWVVIYSKIEIRQEKVPAWSIWKGSVQTLFIAYSARQQVSGKTSIYA